MSDYKRDRARKYYHLNISSQNFMLAMTVSLILELNGIILYFGLRIVAKVYNSTNMCCIFP